MGMDEATQTLRQFRLWRRLDELGQECKQHHILSSSLRAPQLFQSTHFKC
jgi:hypothetical protein